MPTTIHAEEVEDFTTAIAGVEIEYVRTDEGFGPAVMTHAGDGDAMVSVGGIDFSTILQSEAPPDRVVFSLMTSTPQGSTMCGIECTSGRMPVYSPGMTVLGSPRAGIRATTLVVSTDALERVSGELGVPIPAFPGSVEPLTLRPAVRRLTADLLYLSEDLRRLERPHATTRLVEAAVMALTPDAAHRPAAQRRLDSRQIVWDCLDFVDTQELHQPFISDLCRAVWVSESRLRQAFTEVLGMPPSRYFQVRLLSRLRQELLRGDPDRTTVTDVFISLGVTQFGRVAGRYQALYGELPSRTLRRLS